MLGQTKVTVPVAVVALAFWSFLAWDRSSIWRDNFNLFVRSSQQGIRVERIEQNAVAAILRLPHMTNVFVPDPADRRKPATIHPPANPADWQPVLSTLLGAYELFPDEPNLLTALGVAHFCTHQANLAASFFEKAARQAPGNVGVWLNFGRAALDSEQFPKAEAAYRTVLRIDPANLAGLRGLADALLAQHKDAEASAITQQIVSSTLRNKTLD
jgi:tetratricopeptide (TPR) repeat protein